MASPAFDPLTVTASELQDYLESGKLTSEQLVDVYLSEISKSNPYLKAVIATAPRESLLQRAQELDRERSAGKIRSKLHGIPILVKDNIATHPDLGMNTTAGSFALVGSRPKKNADIVERLLKAGAIILGKANLSELSFWKGSKLLCGWSAVGGQSQSAYVRGGIRDDDSIGGHSNPGGSSSGSAIAVSAGLCPVSIGTETDGSLIMPGGRAALYTIKPTVGIVSQQGIIPVSHVCDSAGPMTKSVLDLANLMDVIVDSTKTKVPKGGFVQAMTNNWDNIKVGVVSDLSNWRFPDDFVKPDAGADKQMIEAYSDAYSKLERMAQVFRRDVPLPNKDALKRNGNDCLELVYNGYFQQDFERYTSGLERSLVYKLEELVEFNHQHPDLELPPRYSNQDQLEKILASKISEDEINTCLAHLRRIGRAEGIDKMLRDYDIDVIIGPPEGGMSAMASASGYPIASLPLGYLDLNGRPFALAAIASCHEDATLIKVQSAWEATFPARRPPPRENFQESS